MAIYVIVINPNGDKVSVEEDQVLFYLGHVKGLAGVAIDADLSVYHMTLNTHDVDCIVVRANDELIDIKGITVVVEKRADNVADFVFEARVKNAVGELVTEVAEVGMSLENWTVNTGNHVLQLTGEFKHFKDQLCQTHRKLLK